MSVQSAESRVQYSGNNSTTDAYVVPFYFFSGADLRVVVTDADGQDTMLDLGADYEATGAGDEEGGSIITSLAWDSTHKVTIYRVVDATQLTSYLEGADFPAASHERALDKLTMLVQQNARVFASCFRVRESDGEVAEVAKLANAVFGLDASGNPIFRDADALKTWLSLAAPILNFPTKSWLDDAERALAVPDFVGQIGTQQDTKALYIGTALSNGAWAFSPGVGTILLAMLADGILANSSAGRLKMADGFLSADSAGRAKMADAFITLAKIATGIFTADATGRGKFAGGFVDANLCASGLWNAIAPSGSIIQTVQQEYTGNDNFTAIIPSDDTAPQQGGSEGSEVTALATTITPTSASNFLRVRVSGFVSTNATQGVYALFRDVTPSAIAANSIYIQNSSYPCPFYMERRVLANSTSMTTFKFRIGPAFSGAIRLNGTISGHLFDTAAATTLVVEEIKA